MEKAGVKAWKKVPIVQLGVMREVIRVWVSRAGPQLGLRRVTEPVGEAVGQRLTAGKKHNFQNYRRGFHCESEKT